MTSEAKSIMPWIIGWGMSLYFLVDDLLKQNWLEIIGGLTIQFSIMTGFIIYILDEEKYTSWMKRRRYISMKGHRHVWVKSWASDENELLVFCRVCRDGIESKEKRVATPKEAHVHKVRREEWIKAES